MANITQVLNVEKNLKQLKKGVHASDLDQLLSSSGPFTLFAPNDQAFEKLEKGLMDDLLEPRNRPKLTSLLQNHIVKGKIMFDELKDGDSVTTVGGRVLQVQVKNGAVSIDAVTVTERSGKITNGTVHITDTVFQ